MQRYKFDLPSVSIDFIAASRHLLAHERNSNYIGAAKKYKTIFSYSPF